MNSGASGPIRGSARPSSVTCTRRQPISGAAARRGRAPADLGDELSAEADAQQRRAPLQVAADQLLLRAQPGVCRLLVDVHRAAEHHHRLEAVQRRRRVAERRVPLDQLGTGHLAEHAGPGVAVMDDREDSHSGVR